MIPQFPRFKKLEITDKKDIESITKNFPPYSDYNFVSLISWNTKNKVEISTLNRNLIIKILDYIDNQEFYSLLGKHKIDETIVKLINHAKKKGIATILYLVPELVVKFIKNPEKFDIEKDKDNFDYILSVNDLIALKGKKFRGKKNFINRFKKLYDNQTVVKQIDIAEKIIQKQILTLFNEWKKSRAKSNLETENELNAIRILFNNSHALNLKTIGLFINNRLRAFSINETVHDSHGIIHFEKADISFVGIFQYLKHQSAINFAHHGSKFINYEQDLGVEGLRTAKLSHNPVKFLKKYTIKLRK